jgi:hypothetical protein
MRRTGAVRGGTNGCLKRKVFLKNQKHQPNIVEITHLCIMHGARRFKEPEWEMRRTGRGGLDRLKNRSEKCEGPRWRGGDQWLFEKKSFFKKPKTSTKHC